MSLHVNRVFAGPGRVPGMRTVSRSRETMLSLAGTAVRSWLLLATGASPDAVLASLAVSWAAIKSALGFSQSGSLTGGVL